MSKNVIYVVIAVIVLGVAGFFLLRSNNGSSEKSNTTSTSESNSNQSNSQTPMAEETSAACVRTYKDTDISKVSIKPTDKFVTLTVAGFGDIKIEVNKTAAPKSSENFLKLATAGFYDCISFHRVAKGFVVQGGDPQGTGSGGPGYVVPAEIGLKHTKGAIAMARTGDSINPKRDSSGSQFYIALEALPMLDGQYSVFGNVVAGMDVVEKIGAVKIEGAELGAQDGPPVEPVLITKATVSDK